MKTENRILTLLAMASLAGLAWGCSSTADAGRAASPTARGSVGVTQGGAQDIGEFRAIVNEGEVPAPDTLDPVGFFAEHAVDLPPADCGEQVCLHPMLAVAPRFNGENWTMAFVGMNTPVEPGSLPRPPLHLITVLENSEHTGLTDAQINVAFTEVVASLRPEDRVSLIGLGARAEVLAEGLSPSDPSLAAARAAYTAQESALAVDLYQAIVEAGRLRDRVGADAGFVGESRILLLSSGHADAGITDSARIVGLGEAIAREGTSFSVVGAGPDYDSTVASALGSMGAGTYSYAEGADDLVDILRLEGQTSFHPLALDFELRIRPAPGYRIGAIYGARRARVEGNEAVLASPALMVGQRTGASDVGGGRRGGGGGLFVELFADPETASGIDAGAPAFTAVATYTDAVSGLVVEQQQRIDNGLRPGQNPGGMWPFLTDPARGKPFMMLNMYLALRATVQLHYEGDCARAMGLVDMFQLSVDLWQEEYDDPDIEVDNDLLRMLRGNVRSSCEGVTPVEPTLFEGGCMMS